MNVIKGRFFRLACVSYASYQKKNYSLFMLLKCCLLKRHLSQRNCIAYRDECIVEILVINVVTSIVLSAILISSHYNAMRFLIDCLIEESRIRELSSIQIGSIRAFCLLGCFGFECIRTFWVQK